MPPFNAVFDVQGHRGARGLLPENTLPAFRRALELGVTTLEMDVVVSHDREVVVSHDPWFDPRLCSHPSGEPVTAAEAQDLRIYAMDYAEVARFDCGRRRHPDFPRQVPRPAAKPLLRDVLRAAEAGVEEIERAPLRYNIETKSRPDWEGRFHPDPATFTRLLYDVLLGVLGKDGARERATVQSFDVRTLQAARRLDPHLSFSLLVERRLDRGLAANLDALGFVPAVYSPDYRLVDEALVAAVHEAGMRLLPWTVNDPDAMRRLHDLGADGLITDYPDVACTLFGIDEN